MVNAEKLKSEGDRRLTVFCCVLLNELQLFDVVLRQFCVYFMVLLERINHVKIKTSGQV